jgi:ribosomal protein S18 acetylase RimI-like enzyme
LAKARSSGSLWLYTFARNAIACRFYEKHGFVVAERGFEPHWRLEDVKYVWTGPSHREKVS